jgi:glutamyl-tRNA reductase
LRHQRDAGLLLQQLGNHVDQIRQHELAVLFTARPDLTEADREAVAHMAMRLQNQFLHYPRAAVRSAVTESTQDHGHAHPVLDFIRHIFGLGDRPQNSLRNI